MDKIVDKQSKVGITSCTNVNQHELAALAELAGIKADPTIFRILLELLEMQVEAEALYKLLRSIKRSTISRMHTARVDKVKKENK